MIEKLRNLSKNIPVLLLAFALAVAVWISAVTSTDPTQQRIYPRAVNVEVVGQDPGLVVTSEIPKTVNVTLRAPESIWNRLINEAIPVKAVLDLSGLEAGEHNHNIQIQVGIRPVEIVSCSPCDITLNMEKLVSQEMSIRLVEIGELAVGFQAESPVWNQKTAVVSGPESAVERVEEVLAEFDLNNASETISRAVPLMALDVDGIEVPNISLTPSRINVSMTISQRGGYRNVVVKVSPSGQVASGYRVTNISVFPPTVTVFSQDPKLVDDLPGYVETEALDLTNAKDDLDLRLQLDLPPGVSIVGEQTVAVQVGIAAIEGSITLSDMEIEVEGLSDFLKAAISPEVVDVIISGPLPLLDTLTKNNFRVVVDLTGEEAGTYQRVPTVVFDIPDLRVESILPESVEIILTVATRP